MTALGGTVYLVGAGPGDPGLITGRGRELLASCDAVVVDALAGRRLLELVRDDAEIHDVGKRAGRHSAGQDEINRLLVSLAAQGRAVVRLKGGDPFVFGRGGEECEALAEAGVAFEIVSGVTSAIAAPASAGIPVTHRDWASHVTVVTGHEREDGGETPRVDLAALAGLLPAGTLVFLMGARTLGLICEGLIAGGADPATPAAAVQWGTDPRQRTCVATLATLAERVVEAGLGAPMVTVVGRVVALRDRLRWFERRPLSGRRILVTRARAQASGFLERLRDLGADALELPVIAVEPVAERRQLEAALAAITTDDGRRRYAVFTSANAVQLVWEALLASGRDARDLAGIRVVAIGSETAAALAGHGLRADVVPAEFVAEAVADTLIAEGVAGARVWLPRAALARDVLPDRLRDAGAEVEVLAIYRTVLPADAPDQLAAVLDEGRLDVVTFTSSSTVSHFQTALGGAGFPGGAIAACIGPVTAAAARVAGFPVEVVAAEYTTAGLAAALAAHFGSPGTLQADALSQ